MVRNISDVLCEVDKYKDDIRTVYFHDRNDKMCKCTITFKINIPHILPTSDSQHIVGVINSFISKFGARLHPDLTSDYLQIVLHVKL